MTDVDSVQNDWAALEWAARRTEVEQCLAWVRAFGLAANVAEEDLRGAGVVTAALSAASRILKELEPVAMRTGTGRGSAASPRAAPR